MTALTWETPTVTVVTSTDAVWVMTYLARMEAEGETPVYDELVSEQVRA